eukprot:95134-Chlamydomonas_euryale.AAC.1
MHWGGQHTCMGEISIRAAGAHTLAQRSTALRCCKFGVAALHRGPLRYVALLQVWGGWFAPGPLRYVALLQVRGG